MPGKPTGKKREKDHTEKEKREGSRRKGKSPPKGKSPRRVKSPRGRSPPRKIGKSPRSTRSSNLSTRTTVRNCVWRAVCCRRRWKIEARAENGWVDIGSREQRWVDIQDRRTELNKKLVERWQADDMPLRKVRMRMFKRTLWASLMRAMECCGNCLGRWDEMTGLPYEVLVSLRFLELEHEGMHGFVFKAERKLSGKQRAEYEESLKQRKIEARKNLKKGDPKKDQSVNEIGKDELSVAVRVRDKSKGSVLQLPLGRACTILRSDIIEQEQASIFRRCLERLRLRRRKVTHDNIVKQLGAFNSSEIFVEITEYLGGGSLLAHLQETQSQLDEFGACSVLENVLSALQHMHKSRLMHRDVRVSQVLLASKGDLKRTKLGDFWNVARIPRRGTLLEADRPVDIMTTAPEVLKKNEWSEKADVWSAGCLLFELLFGHPPFGGRGMALVQRICNDDPEFDSRTGRISSNGIDLIKLLLQKNPSTRPTAEMALKHGWFTDFGGDKPAATAKRVAEPINCIKLMGAPLSRAGMPAQNLLAGGSTAAGFCTFMGLTTCTLDFDVIGKAEWQEYWVTSVLISLWGNAENPKTILLQDSTRSGSPYVDIIQHQVEGDWCTEARLTVERPLRHARLSFRGNFGGVYGIALRKTTFYGYEARSAPVVIDMNAAKCERGCTIYVHNSLITDVDLAHRVHKTLATRDLTKGQRIPGINRRYLVLRDFCSGKPHHSSRVETPPLQLPPGMVLCAAMLGLRYVSLAPSLAAPPQLRVRMLQEKEEGGFHKTQLFDTGGLNPPEWTPDEIMGNGYKEHPPMFLDGLAFSTDEILRVELLFENNAGMVHTPAFFGLVFYYIPELSTPNSEPDEIESPTGENDKPSPSSQERKLHVAEAQIAKKQHLSATAEAAQELVEIASNHAESETREREMQATFKAAHHKAMYGERGPGQLRTQEVELWKEPAHGVFGTRRPWWESAAPEDLASSMGWGGSAASGIVQSSNWGGGSQEGKDVSVASSKDDDEGELEEVSSDDSNKNLDAKGNATWAATDLDHRAVQALAADRIGALQLQATTIAEKRSEMRRLRAEQRELERQRAEADAKGEAAANGPQWALPLTVMTAGLPPLPFTTCAEGMRYAKQVSTRPLTACQPPRPTRARSNALKDGSDDDDDSEEDTEEGELEPEEETEHEEGAP